MALRSRLLVAALLAFTLAPSDGRAVEFSLWKQPLRLDLTESLYANWHGDPGNGDSSSANFGELVSRFNAQLAWKRWLIGLRWDLALYVDAPEVGQRRANLPSCPAPGDPKYGTAADPCVVRAGQLETQGYERYRQTPFDPRKFFEKMFISYSGRSVDATLGDFYVNFGRGLVLSIRKVDELGVDTSLFGGKLAVHQGDFTGAVVAGFTNIQNVDEATATYTPDPYDFVSGLHADYRLFDKIAVGVNGMFGLPAACPQKNPDAAQTCPTAPKDPDFYLRYGVSLDAPRLLPWLAVYAEYARGDDRITLKQRSANALYVATTAFVGRASWLLEVKWYDNYLPWHSSNDPFGSLVYMQPPTLERVITQINNNTDILAGRLRVDLAVNANLTLFASSELGRSHPAPELTDTLEDFYGGAQLRWNQGRSHFFPLVGYRLEREVGDAAADPPRAPSTYEQLVAIEFDAAQALPHGLSVEAAGLIWLRQEAGKGDWQEGNVYLSVKWAPRFILAAGYEFTTIETEKYHQHDFLNASLTWNITSGTSLTLFGGGQRPGLKCISGVCRVFPAFQGVRLALVVRL